MTRFYLLVSDVFVFVGQWCLAMATVFTRKARQRIGIPEEPAK